MELEVSKLADAGLFEFLSQYLKLTPTSDEIKLQLELSNKGDEAKQEVVLQIADTTYDPLQSQEVLKRIRTSQVFFFHNSTELLPPEFYRKLGYAGNPAGTLWRRQCTSRNGKEVYEQNTEEDR